MTPDVITVKKDWTIKKLIKTLQDNSITGAPVVDDKGGIIGIVSVKDVIKAVSGLMKVQLSIKEINEMRGKFNWVEGIMTTGAITVGADDDVKDVFRLMVEKHIHRVPVMEKGEMAGIISVSDAYRVIVGTILNL
jgi:CBS domain-containing protein